MIKLNQYIFILFGYCIICHRKDNEKIKSRGEEKPREGNIIKLDIQWVEGQGNRLGV